MKEIVKEAKQVNSIVATINTSVPMKARLKAAKDYILDLEDTTQVGFKLKYLKKFIESILGAEGVSGDKEVKERIQKDTEKFLEANPNFKGVKNQVVHSFWDYSNCNHIELNELYDIEKQVKGRIKELETELKSFGEATRGDNNKVFQEGKMSLGSGTKNILVEYTHKLDSVESNEAICINPPVNITKIGLKYYLSAIEEK